MVPSVELPATLFKRWKSGDADAGQEMAQRFSDWYFAIAAVRHGEQRSRPGLEKACQLFAQGIGSVHQAQDLEEWAYGLLNGELQALESLPRGADEPSRLTGSRLPSRLLRRCVAEAECPGLPLLAMAWNPEIPTAQLMELAEASGGFPLSILKARYELKAWLSEKEAVPFAETPGQSNLDYLPLPLYEAGRLSAEEARNFEHWLLQDPALRKDAMEFSNFSMALHDGVLKSLCAQAKAVSNKRTPPDDSPTPSFSYQVPDAGWSPEPWMIAIGACVLGILAAFLTLS
jgi:hypothetical protein